MPLSATRYYLFVFLCMVCAFSPIHARGQIDIIVITPKPDSLVPSQNLFISIEVDTNHHFASAGSVEFFLDDYLITGITKIAGNKVRFVYPYKIRDGRHTIKIEAKFKEFKRSQHGSWTFYAGKKGGRVSTQGDVPPEKEQFKINGTISVDDREESISGSGSALRQEPVYTRTVNIDAVASYKSNEIPIKIFATSNNLPGIQSMNYFQVGYRNRWMEMAIGDMNPVFDQLVLNGVRIQGVGLKLKSHLSSIQVFYGDMARPLDGVLQLFQAGQGVLPTNVVKDSFFVTPGIYHRTMMAAKVDLGSPKDEVRFCASVFKAKDDVGSITYGLLPKDNVVGGLDIVVKAFHKKVIIKAGMAVSILTNDINGGALSRDSLKATYKVDPPFDPMVYKNIIILNASTLPANISPAFNNMATMAELTYFNKFQTFTIDAKNIGPLYYSLGNPFLLNDYQGIHANERFSLLNKKVSIGLGYQNFSNDLDLTTYTKVYTQGYSGNLMVNPGIKWPSLMFNYLNLTRNGTSDVANYPGISDNLTNALLNISYGTTFLKIKHRFRVMLNVSNRDDQINLQNKYTSVNGMIGVSEGLSRKLNLTADVGKTIITGYDNERLSDVLVYNFSIDWQIKPQHYFTSFALSNNQAFLTPFSNPSFRFSAIGRFGYRFYKGMGIDVEGGYQPFFDQLNAYNSYNELYAYVRYSCDLGRLFEKDKPKNATAVIER
jgi:hypothetical protein